MTPQPQDRGVPRGSRGHVSWCPRTVGPRRKMALWEDGLHRQEPGMEGSGGSPRGRAGAWRPPSGRGGGGRPSGRARLPLPAPSAPPGPVRAPPHVAQTPPRARRAAERPRSFPSAACAGAKQPGPFANEERSHALSSLEPFARGLQEPLGSRPPPAVLSSARPIHPTSQNHRPDQKGQPRDPHSSRTWPFLLLLKSLAWPVRAILEGRLDWPPENAESSWCSGPE